jgi:hypothetical protein
MPERFSAVEHGTLRSGQLANFTTQKQLADAGNVARNPQGPEMPFDPAEPLEKKRVQKRRFVSLHRPSIAPVAWCAHAAKARSIRGPITSDSVAR